MLVHTASPEFWALYKSLPKEDQELADKNYQLLQQDPSYPSLHFKQVKPTLWSARVGKHYRALALREDESCYWFWIGHHSEYDKLLG